jgi:hypothetical protein
MGHVYQITPRKYLEQKELRGTPAIRFIGDAVPQQGSPQISGEHRFTCFRDDNNYLPDLGQFTVGTGLMAEVEESPGSPGKDQRRLFSFRPVSQLPPVAAAYEQQQHHQQQYQQPPQHQQQDAVREQVTFDPVNHAAQLLRVYNGLRLGAERLIVKIEPEQLARFAETVCANCPPHSVGAGFEDEVVRALEAAKVNTGDQPGW